jgi:hypothetical protein
MKLSKTLFVPAVGLVLSACAPASGPPAGMSSNAIAVATLQKVNSQAHACWLKDSDFADYGLVPELDTTSTPRLLVIPRGKPQSLPQAVIIASRAARYSTARSRPRRSPAGSKMTFRAGPQAAPAAAPHLPGGCWHRPCPQFSALFSQKSKLQVPTGPSLRYMHSHAQDKKGDHRHEHPKHRSHHRRADCCPRAQARGIPAHSRSDRA